MRETATPSVLGPYDVLGSLHEGDTARIFLAKLRGVGGFSRLVALKVIRPQIARDADFTARFFDEVRIGAMLQHRNVVQTQDVQETEDGLFAVMEYVEGESLRALLRKCGRLDDEEAAYLVAEACAGLHAAHELVDEHGYPMNLVHRNVSPENILISYDGEVKVLDFGIAKAGSIARTRIGQVAGEVAYLAPEQALGQKPDLRADLFALGAVWYEAVVGKAPFERRSVAGTVGALLSERPAPPSAQRPDLCASVDELCLLALRRDPNDRFASAETMGRRVREAFGDEALSRGQGVLARRMKDVFAESKARKEEMGRRRVDSAPRRRSSREIPSAGRSLGISDSFEFEVMPSGAVRVRVRGGLGKKTSASEVQAREGRRSWWVAMGASLAFVGALLIPLVLWTRPLGGTSAGPDPANPAERHAHTVARAERGSDGPHTGGAQPPAPGSIPDEGLGSEDAQVTVQVDSEPAEARVFFDESFMGVTPLRTRVERTERRVSLRLIKAGHRGEETSFVPDRDVAVEMTLSPIRTRRSQPTRESKTDPETKPAVHPPKFTRFE